MGPTELTRIAEAIRKQEAAEAIQLIHLWRNEIGWRGEWFDVRKPKQRDLIGGTGSSQQLAFLVDDLQDIEAATGRTIHHVAIGTDGVVRVWDQARAGGPIRYARGG